MNQILESLLRMSSLVVVHCRRPMLEVGNATGGISIWTEKIKKETTRTLEK